MTKDVPKWQVPFRGGASMILLAIPIGLAVLGFLLVLSIVLNFLGIRDHIMPLWPLG